ncbi:hypothetical protein WBG78_13445 [Chryseolinea sp. T2]|uniref:hypothetical protein n=1 Tax=Chryseolinea sp. T2 TaxID=3129255 RepID=UPI0030784C3A
MIRFVGIVMAVAVGCILVVMLSENQGWIEAAPSYSMQTAAILAVFTIVIYRYLDKIEKPELFIQIYLLSMTIKLIAYGVYVVLMIVDDKPGANSNVLFFLILYVVFTALEVGFLHRKIAGNRPH